MNERLEEIREHEIIADNECGEYERHKVDFYYEHVGWLIEQAERVEELEERLEGSHKYTDALRYRVEELVRQKKRYREMIDEIREYITGCEKVDTEVVSDVIGDIIDEAGEVTE